LRVPWRVQPPRTIPVDRNKPYARSVMLVAGPQDGFIDATRQHSLTWSNVTVEASAGGQAWRYSSSSIISTPNGPQFSSVDPGWTIFGVVRSTGTSAGQFILTKDYESNLVPFSLSIGGRGDVLDGAAYLGASGWKYSSISRNIRNDGLVHVVVGVCNLAAGTISVWIDGVLDSSGSTSGSTLTANSGNVSIGRFINDGQSFSGDIYHVGYDPRPWTGSEIGSFTNSYSALLANRVLRIPTAASVLPTLSAPTYAPGSLSSSGWIPQVTAT
jgi:Concanavalin A-like lectin/glucanases superfamily